MPLRFMKMQKNNRGILTVVSGFSGAGKGTIMNALMAQHSDRYALSISATTRQPRPGERDGIDYFFKTREEFEQMIADDLLIEHAEYVGNYYGTPRAYVEEQLSLGKDVLLEIEIQGAMQVKAKYPDALLLFVTPPDIEELKNRLCGRGTESDEVIESRLKRAAQESLGVEDYDYLVINDILEECVNEVDAIIRCERARMFRNTDYINTIKIELGCFMR
jgi:guanylate kinase